MNTIMSDNTPPPIPKPYETCDCPACDPGQSPPPNEGTPLTSTVERAVREAVAAFGIKEVKQESPPAIPTTDFDEPLTELVEVRSVSEEQLMKGFSVRTVKFRGSPLTDTDLVVRDYVSPGSPAPALGSRFWLTLTPAP
jgi:hypothetical protein